MRQLLIATHNPDKLREFREIFAELPLVLVSLGDVGVTVEVEETGSTFEANAILKARAYGAATGLLTLADDSGIEVDALGGEPGVLSSRFAGPNTSGEKRNHILLERLAAMLPSQRTARYRCVIAIAIPDNGIEIVEGKCEGVIASAPRGAGGFGYDPIFYLPELGRTTAELSSAQKHEISHRGRAAREARKVLERLSGEPENS